MCSTERYRLLTLFPRTGQNGAREHGQYGDNEESANEHAMSIRLGKNAGCLRTGVALYTMGEGSETSKGRLARLDVRLRCCTARKDGYRCDAG